MKYERRTRHKCTLAHEKVFPESKRYGLSCGIERWLLVELILSMHAVWCDMSLALLRPAVFGELFQR